MRSPPAAIGEAMHLQDVAGAIVAKLVPSNTVAAVTRTVWPNTTRRVGRGLRQHRSLDLAFDRDAGAVRGGSMSPLPAVIAPPWTRTTMPSLRSCVSAPLASSSSSRRGRVVLEAHAVDDHRAEAADAPRGETNPCRRCPTPPMVPSTVAPATAAAAGGQTTSRPR
jgi:hypothetical protein